MFLLYLALENRWLPVATPDTHRQKSLVFWGETPRLLWLILWLIWVYGSYLGIILILPFYYDLEISIPCIM